MHLLAIILVLLVVWHLRMTPVTTDQTWEARWLNSLFKFLLPPLLLLTTAIAVLFMGCHGSMLGIKAGWLGCTVSWSFLAVGAVLLLKRTYQGYRAIEQLADYPQISVGDRQAALLDTNFPYSAQIGFWNSQLVISQGLLASLNTEQIDAVLAHEQAHLYYRDTFWFFWLGWLRQLTSWLPNTEELWQELLLLRELRADRQAAKEVDSLLLAEVLVAVAKAPYQQQELLCANLSHPAFNNRLAERIEFLLDDGNSITVDHWQSWSWLSLILIPLLTIPLHS